MCRVYRINTILQDRKIRESAISQFLTREKVFWPPRSLKPSTVLGGVGVVSASLKSGVLVDREEPTKANIGKVSTGQIQLLR